MTVRYVMTKVEVCEKCDGTGWIDGGLWDYHCIPCRGKGEFRTEIDADAWLREQLDGYGLLGDGK